MQIHEIIGITKQPLRKQALNNITVEECMAWAVNRYIIEEENWVNCLVGIFDIFMPLVYGKGRTKALLGFSRDIDDAF